MTAHQPIAPGKYRLRVDDYVQLSDAGSFDGVRTELIGGDVWIMSPAHSRHALVQSQMDFALRTALLASTLEVYAAPSVRLTEDTMPEPDLVVGAWLGDGLLEAGDVRLVIEIADSSIERDLGPKVSLYATAGVPEYWVVDVAARVIHQHWRPQGEGYAERAEHPFGAPLTAATVPDLTIDTARL